MSPPPQGPSMHPPQLRLQQDVALWRHRLQGRSEAENRPSLTPRQRHWLPSERRRKLRSARFGIVDILRLRWISPMWAALLRRAARRADQTRSGMVRGKLPQRLKDPPMRGDRHSRRRRLGQALLRRRRHWLRHPAPPRQGACHPHRRSCPRGLEGPLGLPRRWEDHPRHTPRETACSFFKFCSVPSLFLIDWDREQPNR